MINTNEILDTIRMIDQQHLDIRTIAPQGWRPAGTPFFYFLGASELPLRQDFGPGPKCLYAPPGASPLRGCQFCAGGFDFD